MPSSPLLQSQVPGYSCRRGKVRDVYDLGDRLVIVATDRISAFDWVLPTGIPDKGRVLTMLSLFWFDFLGIPHHLLSTDLQDMGPEFAARADLLTGRTMLVQKAQVVPIECVVRGYLAGSGWKEYQASRTVCGIPLPPGLQQSQVLPEPIFTPATKEESGHDQNISFERMAQLVGGSLAENLRQSSLWVYNRALQRARSKGIIIADTKFEWGQGPGGVLLIDEVLTPDSSLLAEGRLSSGHQSAFVRQAVCPRLAGNHRLGQEQSAAGVAARGGGPDPREIPGSLPASDGPNPLTGLHLGFCALQEIRTVHIPGWGDYILHLPGVKNRCEFRRNRII